MLLLETSTISIYLKQSTENKDILSTHNETKKEQNKHVNRVMEQFTEAASKPCNLIKLCILAIRQCMPSNRQEDYDQLHLAPRLRSLATFEYLIK